MGNFLFHSVAELSDSVYGDSLTLYDHSCDDLPEDTGGKYHRKTGGYVEYYFIVF